MTREEAQKIVGNQPKWALSNMAHALQMMSWENSPEENQQLEALHVLGYKVVAPQAEWLWAAPLNRS